MEEDKILKVGRATLLTSKIILIMWIVFFVYAIFIPSTNGDDGGLGKGIVCVFIALILIILSLFSGVSGSIREKKINSLQDNPEVKSLAFRLRIYSSLVVIPIIIIIALIVLRVLTR